MQRAWQHSHASTGRGPGGVFDTLIRRRRRLEMQLAQGWQLMEPVSAAGSGKDAHGKPVKAMVVVISMCLDMMLGRMKANSPKGSRCCGWLLRRPLAAGAWDGTGRLGASTCTSCPKRIPSLARSRRSRAWTASPRPWLHLLYFVVL